MPSFICQFSISALVLLLWVFEGSRGLSCCNDGCRPGHFETVIGPGCKVLYPNMDLCHSLGRCRLEFSRLPREWA